MGPLTGMLQPLIDKIDEGQGEATNALHALLKSMGQMLDEVRESNRLLQALIYQSKESSGDISNIDATLHELNKKVD
mgnify:CR=1 FL=1